MKCKNCGAKIKTNEVQCPYCSYMNEEAANRRYMGRLHELHTGMDELKWQPKKTLKQEIGKTMLITAAAMAAAIGFGFLWDAVTSGATTVDIRVSDEKAKEKIAWAEEYEPILDAMYEAGDFEGLMDMYETRYDQDYANFYDWDHEELLRMMDRYQNMEEFVEDVEGDSSWYSSYMVVNALDNGMQILYEYGTPEEWSGTASISEKEAAFREEMRQEVFRIFEEYLQIKPDEIDPLYELLQEDGYLSYTACREYAEELYEELFADRKEAD